MQKDLGIELAYRKKSLFVNVSQINYLICSPLSNHDILLNLVQQMLNVYIWYALAAFGLVES